MNRPLTKEECDQISEFVRIGMAPVEFNLTKALSGLLDSAAYWQDRAIKAEKELEGMRAAYGVKGGAKA